MDRKLALILTIGIAAMNGLVSAQDKAEGENVLYLHLPKVGDTCAYARKSHNRDQPPYIQVVVEVNTSGYVANFQNEQGAVTEKAHYTREGNIYLNEGVNGKYPSTPFVPRFKSPLSVADDSWEGKYTFTPQAGGQGEADVKSKAEGWELVKVPAGTFRAVRITMRGAYRESTSQGSGSGGINETIWYAPETGCVLKHIRQYTGWTGSLSVNTLRELVSFRKN